MFYFSHAFSSLTHYFPRHLSVQLREFYLTIGILDFAVAAVTIFEPIYLFQLGYSIPAIILFYLGVYILYFVTLPLGAKVALSYGYSKSIVTSSFFYILYYGALFGLAYSSAFIILAVFSLAAQKILFWPSFHAEFARYGNDHEEAREVSARTVIDIAVSVAGPLFGGVILALSNFPTLFFVVGTLILLSNIPILTIPENFTIAEFSYRKAYQRLWSPEYRRLSAAFLAYGEEFIVLILWPLYMYTFIEDLLSLGSLVAATTLITMTAVLYMGRVTDHGNKRIILKISSFSYAAVWLGRLFISSVMGVFIADTLSRLTKRLLEVPLLSILYTRARAKHHIMRHAVLFEMSLVVGKILAMIIALVIFVLWPSAAWPIVFIIAALFTLLYSLL